MDGGGRPIQFDPMPVLTAIALLPFSDDGNGRYLLDDDGNAISAWPDVSASRVALKFCQVRRNGLPQVERGGVVDDLKIAADAGLLEPIHVVFFGENIVGADFNFYGPRISRLGYYLRTKSRMNGPPLHFLPLLRQDVTQQLNRLDEISLFDLRIKASYADAIKQADASLGDAFAANARILDGDAEDIQLVLRPAREMRRGAWQRLRHAVGNLVGSSDLRENAERFQIRGRLSDTGKADTIDLLHDQLIATKQILRVDERIRAVQADSAYQAIESAYGELRDALRSAAGLVS